MKDLIDVSRQQLGWYVRNCALSPAAGMLEGVLRDVVEREPLGQSREVKVALSGLFRPDARHQGQGPKERGRLSRMGRRTDRSVS
jgi:hypothetical protein